MMGFMFPAVFFGWSLGANDAANIFGTAVTNGVVRYRTAIILSAVFVVIGAVLQGSRGLSNIGELAQASLMSGGIAVLSAAITMTLMTVLSIPVSSSQALIGAIIAINLSTGQEIQWGILSTILFAWFLTPLLGMVFGWVCYFPLSFFFKRINNVFLQDQFLRYATLVVGSYGAFALGANNVANVTGVFAPMIGVQATAWLGGGAIALGVLTYSKRVMYTVGKKILPLDYFSSTIAVLAHALCIWVFALVGIPVSSSQAIVGAVIGAGYAKGSRLGNKKVLFRIFSAWINTPIASGVICYGMVFVLRFFGVEIQ